MKKQLLIAAVAATMTSVATADISITGGAKVNYTNVDGGTAVTTASNLFKHDMDLTVKGNSGDTNVVMVVSNAKASTNAVSGSLAVEDVYLTSKIGDVNVKLGQYQSTSDSMISNATSSTRNSGRFTADTTIGGVKITYVDQNDSAEAIILSGEVSGVALSHKMGNAGAGSTNDYTDTKVSATVGGVDLYYRTKDYDAASSADFDVVKVSANVGDIALTYAQAEASTAAGTFSMEDVFGEYNTINTTKGVKASTSSR